MSKVVVIGGSVCGIGAAIALADRGHQVHVVERIAELPPVTVSDAAEWKRPTVPQAVHSHAFASLGCNLLRDRAPDVFDGLLAAGCEEINLADYHPPTLTDFQRIAADDALRMLIARRSTFELVLRQRALARPEVTLSSGWKAAGLVYDPNDHLRVKGVRSTEGEILSADIVVDATGRRSEVRSWLEKDGLPTPESVTDSCKIIYYTRHYRLLSSQMPGPFNRGFGSGGLWDSYTAVLFRGDNDTFTISLGVLPEDTQLKSLKHEAAFTAAIRATPLLADWVAEAASEPISDVYVMSGLDNSIQMPSQEGPLVTGLFRIGDAACTTNPAYGRGVSLSLSHGFLLADVLEDRPVVGTDQTADFIQRSEQLMRPWYDESVANDRFRVAMWEGSLHGQPMGRPPMGVVTFGLAVAASTRDAEVWRRVANVMMMLAPPAALYAADDIKTRIGQVMAAGGPPPQPPGASREDLVSAVLEAVGMTVTV